MKEILTVSFVAIALATGLLWLGFTLSEKSCYKMYPNNNPTYSVLTDCMIEVNGQRIPSSKYRVID